MSPRAAWRLERLGYQAHDYAGGKMDWLGWGFPRDGNADLVIDHLDRLATTCRHDEPVASVAARAAGSSRVVVLNQAGVVMGILPEALHGAGDRDTAEQWMASGRPPYGPARR